MTTKPFNFKKYFFAIFLLLVALVSAQKKFIIVLDAGHGGSDIGTNRSYSDLGTVMEKDITLGIVLRLGKMLEKDKDFKVIYTRKIDEFPSLYYRTNLANRNKADLFVSVHVNATPAKSTETEGTETYIQGPNQNKTNLEVTKAENDVIFLDNKDKEVFSSYDPNSPESLIALKIQQNKYLESSTLFGSMVEENFEKKANRYSRGIKQANLHVLRMNAMPSVLIETGFINNYKDAYYLSSDKGQQEIAVNIYDAIISYKKLMDRNTQYEVKEPEKPKENPLSNDFRVLLMTSTTRYNSDDPALKGLNNILTIKEGGIYKYYFGNTNLASLRDANLKTAKDAGFKNAYAIGFMPNQKLSTAYYNIELLVSKDKLSSNSYILQTLKNVDRNKEKGMFYYTYGSYSTLEDAIKEQEELDKKGIKNTVIQKSFK